MASQAVNNITNNKEDYLLLRTLRVDALYNNAVIPVIAMLCGALGLLITFWDKNNSSVLLLWFGAMIITTVGRCLIVLKYHSSPKKTEDYPFWLNLYFSGTFISGCIWGTTSYLLPVENSVTELGLITMFMLVAISASIGIYSVFKRVYYALSLPTILSLIFFLTLQENPQLNTLGIITAIFTFFIFIIHYHAHRIINQLLILKFDNQSLLDHYKHDQEKISIL